MGKKRDVRDDQCYDILNDIIRVMSNPRSADNHRDREKQVTRADKKQQKSSDEEDDG